MKRLLLILCVLALAVPAQAFEPPFIETGVWLTKPGADGKPYGIMPGLILVADAGMPVDFGVGYAPADLNELDSTSMLLFTRYDAKAFSWQNSKGETWNLEFDLWAAGELGSGTDIVDRSFVIGTHVNKDTWKGLGLTIRGAYHWTDLTDDWTGVAVMLVWDK